MARYKVSFSIAGKAYYTEGESSYPTDEDLEKNDIDMGIALDCAGVIASAYKSMNHLDERIDPNSIAFEIYKD